MLLISIYMYVYIIDSFVASIEYKLSNLNNYYFCRYRRRREHDLSRSESERVACFVGYFHWLKGRGQI
jgi:hypothetical protein